MTNQNEPPVSYRARVARWMRSEIKQGEPVSIPELKRRARETFRADETFMDALYQEYEDTMFYDIAQRVVAETRAPLRPILVDDQIVPRDEYLARSAREGHPVFARWVERVGKVEIPLLKMTRAHLLEAAETRQEASDYNGTLARLWRTLAGRLTGDQEVGDVFTTEDIQRIKARIESGEEAA